MLPTEKSLPRTTHNDNWLSIAGERLLFDYSLKSAYAYQRKDRSSE